MRKALATVIVGAIAAAGISAGAIFLSPATADAQEDAVTETTSGPLEEILGELVTEGVINQDQADAVADRLREAGPFHRPHHQRGAHLETIADVLGIERSELVEALRDGDSVADLAGDQTDDVINALVDDATDRLGEAVESERLTREEADEKLAEITDRITDMVNGEIDFSERRRPGPGGGGPFGPPPADDASNDV